MVVAAHPDDELLGPGGAMHRLILDYDVTAHVVILGEGITSRANQRDPEQWQKELEVHRKNMKEATEKIGYDSLSSHDFPDNRFDTVALLDIIKVIEKEKEEFQPDVIFTHHGGDLNIDHRKTFEAVMTSCRPLEGEKTTAILTFETPSSTEWATEGETAPFRPNLFIEISKGDLKAKIDGMECYHYEKRGWPHPRSPKALTIRAQYWGSVIGTDYAEPFTLIRGIFREQGIGDRG